MSRHMVNQRRSALQFQRTLDLLRDPEAPYTAEAIYTLSDLSGERLDAFRALWDQLSAERRRSLIVHLVETAETNFELDFSAIINPALDDSDMDVRVAAVEGVLEDSSNPVIERLMQLAQEDPFSDVRAAAARALGPFVLRGELGKLSARLNQRLQDTLLALHLNENEDLDVRRRALEAIGNCGREGVRDLIHDAYQSDEAPMRVSAVFAMGRSCDDSWAPQVLDELSSDDPELRFEAARAAGELELRKALPRLAELAYDDDREIQEMAIWSMGEIGGSSVNQILAELAALADSNDDYELVEAIAEAQASSALVADSELPLLEFEELDEDFEADELYGMDGDRFADGDEDLDDFEELEDLEVMDEIDDLDGDDTY